MMTVFGYFDGLEYTVTTDWEPKGSSKVKVTLPDKMVMDDVDGDERLKDKSIYFQFQNKD